MKLFFSKMSLAFIGMLALGDAQDNKVTNLRKGKALYDKERNETDLSLQSFGTLSKEDEIQRIVVKCKTGQDQDECLDSIMTLVPDGSMMKIIHKLKHANSYAISIRSSQVKEIDLRGFELYDDPIRQPLYLKESIQVHRELQSGQTIPYGITMVKAQEAWQLYGVKGEGTKVCVMDTGLNAQHSDLTRSKLTGYSGNEAVTPWDQDREGHGTHVTGTIAAADNTRGVVGVAPEAEIYTVRVFGRAGFFGSDVVAAAEACRDAGANIISMSLGGPQYDPDEQAIFEELYNEGVIAIAAAGNSGGNDYSFPASYEEVVSVAAVDSDGELASFSTKNNRVDVAAPGVGVWSTWNNGGYASISGTSMATPHVAGVVALMRSYAPDATPAEVYNALINTADNPTAQGRDNLYGHGVVNALAAVGQLVNRENPPVKPPSNPGDDCGSNEIFFELTLATNGLGDESSWELTDSNGKVVTSGDRYTNNRSYNIQQCLPNGCFTLTVYDSEGYSVRVNGQVLASGSTLSEEEVIPNVGNCQPGGGEPVCVDIEVSVTTDRYGYETSHSLRSAEDDTFFWNRQRLGNNRVYAETACVDPTGCYRYEIADSYGDGIFGNGLQLKYDGQVVYAGGNFGTGGYRNLGDGC